MNLNDLDVDTLTLILSALCRLSEKRRLALRPVSLVSRRLRSVTIRWIFVTYKWALDCPPPYNVPQGRAPKSFPELIKSRLRRLLRIRDPQRLTAQTHMDVDLKVIDHPENSVLPRHLRSYVQHLIFRDVRWPEYMEYYHHQERLEVLIRIIPQMTSLRTFILWCTNPSEAMRNNVNNILAAFSTLPLLETVALRKLPWDVVELPHGFPALQHLIVGFGPQRTQVNGQRAYHDPLCNRLLHMSEDPWFRRDFRFSMSSTATSLLLRQSCSLRELEIPSELISFDALVSVQWPALQSLVLTGDAPQGGGGSVLGILRSMPQLQVLHLHFARRDPRDSTFVLVSPGGLPDGYLHGILPKLQSFTLSNVSEEEEVFIHLPSTVTSLSLPVLGYQGACSYWILEKTVLGIMDRVSASGARLASLSLSLEGLPSPAFIAHLSTTFPDLQSLELHQSFGRERVGRHSWNSYMDALSRFEHLHTLWIAMPSLHRPHEIFGPMDEGNDVLEECARLIATQLKGISTLALEYHVEQEWFTWNEWLTWDVLRDPNNLPVLRCPGNPICLFATLGMPI